MIESIIALRKASKDDADLLFKWINDPETRTNSFSQKAIDLQEHIAWLQNVLASKESILLIAEVNNVPIGQLRIDNKEPMPILNYSIAKEFRNKGFGKKLLFTLFDYIRENNLPYLCLTARVKHQNYFSQRCILNAGFIENKRNDRYIEYKKDL